MQVDDTWAYKKQSLRRIQQIQTRMVTRQILLKRKRDWLKTRQPQKKRQERKCLRVAGKSYTNVKGNKVKERERKEFTCNKCHLKCNSTFSDDEKNEFFVGFRKWGETVIIKSDKGSTLSVIQFRWSQHNVTCVFVVCCFLAAFSISEKCVRVCLEKE